MTLQFGEQVKNEAKKLLEQGKDANQIAKILFDKDTEGYNYGIGIILDGNGKPMTTSATLLEYSMAELQKSKSGTYMNSAAVMAKVKEAVLKWQRIPETYWPNFELILPSDAGTGAVKSAVEVALLLNKGLTKLGVEELGWPAYKSIATTACLNYQEYPSDSIICEAGTLPVYQCGPMNTTGRVNTSKVISERAKCAAKHGIYPVLDRAYSGFEFARLIMSQSYDAIMRMSYEHQVQPFIEEGVPFALAMSPTKAFVSFALRPCGLLLFFSPESSKAKELTTTLNCIMRARGSAFEHAITRAFVKALISDLPRLENEHKHALSRLYESEAIWGKLVKNTPMENLFSQNYAGLFRNPKAKEEAAAHIYDQHLYPVLSQARCRLNVTGIPTDPELAKKHVQVFANFCYEN